jgi:uncharacterized protein YjdB
VIWSSGNTTVATVNTTGKVTGIAEGTATITVTTVEGGFTATCEVTVIASYVSPTGIAVTPTMLNLDKGAQHSLVAVVQPAGANPTVTWTSSTPAIATVDADGKVTALAAGKATITAKTINNYSATCTVTVTVPVTSIVIDPAECTIPLKGTKVLKATVYPSDASNKTIVWSSADATIATVNAAGIVTAKSINGEVEIYATNAASGVIGICTVTVGSGNGKIAQAEQWTIDNGQLTIYPNPTNGQLTIDNGELTIENIEIFDVMGRNVGANLYGRPNNTDIGQSNIGKSEIDISHLPSGVYFIQIKTENEMITRKVIKQ